MGATTHASCFDVTNTSAIKSAVTDIKSRIGDIDILSKICNQGIFVKAETQGICMIGTKK